VPLVCQSGRPMATEIPRTRQDAYKTLARAQQMLRSFCSYSMGVDLTSVVDASAHAVGKETQDLCDAIGVQTTYDPMQVGKFIESGNIQGGADPAVRRDLTFTAASDSTFF
jgi:hypothetical protein